MVVGQFAPILFKLIQSGQQLKFCAEKFEIKVSEMVFQGICFVCVRIFNNITLYVKI